MRSQSLGPEATPDDPQDVAVEHIAGHAPEQVERVTLLALADTRRDPQGSAAAAGFAPTYRPGILPRKGAVQFQKPRTLGFVRGCAEVQVDAAQIVDLGHGDLNVVVVVERQDAVQGLVDALDVVHVEQRRVQARPVAPELHFYELQPRVEDILEHLAQAIRECPVHSGWRLVEERDEVLEVGFLADDLVDDAEQRPVLGVGLDEALDAGDQVGR